MGYCSGVVYRNGTGGGITMTFIPKFIACLLPLLLFGIACRSEHPEKVDHRPPDSAQRVSPDSVFLLVEYSPQRADTSRMLLIAFDSLTALDVLQAAAERDSVFLQIKNRKQDDLFRPGKDMHLSLLLKRLLFLFVNTYIE